MRYKEIGIVVKDGKIKMPTGSSVGIAQYRFLYTRALDVCQSFN